MTLSHILDGSVAQVLANVPYIAVSGGVAYGLKAGLVWPDRPTRVDNHKRLCPISELQPLRDASGVTFCSLQVEKFKHDLSELSEG